LRDIFSTEGSLRQGCRWDFLKLHPKKFEWTYWQSGWKAAYWPSLFVVILEQFFFRFKYTILSWVVNVVQPNLTLTKLECLKLYLNSNKSLFRCFKHFQHYRNFQTFYRQIWQPWHEKEGGNNHLFDGDVV